MAVPSRETFEEISKKLGVSLPLDKAGMKKLKAQWQELTEQNESLRPQLEQIDFAIAPLQESFADAGSGGEIYFLVMLPLWTTLLCSYTVSGKEIFCFPLSSNDFRFNEPIF